MRALGDALQKSLGQPLVIENKPGGAGNIAARACQDAAPMAIRLHHQRRSARL